MDGFTVGFMVRELQKKLVGGKLDKINQPEKDTLLLTVRSGSTCRLLLSANANQARLQLTEQKYENPAEPPAFCMFLRRRLAGARIAAVEQLCGDRIVRISLDCYNEMNDAVVRRLYLEMMGRYSNLILTDEEDNILEAIRHVNREMSRVRTVLPGGVYELPPQNGKKPISDWTQTEITDALTNTELSLRKWLMAHVSGMAGVCAAEICARLGEEESHLSAPPEEVAARLQENFASLDLSPVTLYDEDGFAADFFPFPYLTRDAARQRKTESLSAAMDAFYAGRDLHQRMLQRGAALQRQIKTVLERAEKKRGMMAQTLQSTEKTEQDRIFGELLTANLHLLKKGAESVTLVNYYDPDCGEVTIPLSSMLTPAQNAQRYYKRYRKAKTAEQYAAEQIVLCEKDIEVLENALLDLEKCENTSDLTELRWHLEQSGYLKPERHTPTARNRKPPQGKPLRFEIPGGVIAEVGKNAPQNERLTFGARGEEIWLHAQGIPGSHVILHTEEENPPEEALLMAAKLAAYYSKGRNRPDQAVDYTRRRYVKKIPGAPAGLVTYTHFKTMIPKVTAADCAWIAQKES